MHPCEDLQPGLVLALALHRQMAGEVLELEVALSRRRVGGEELCEPTRSGRAEGDVDEREPLEDLVLDRLRPAAADPHHALGSSDFRRLASPRWATNRLSAASRIEQVLNRIRSASARSSASV